MKVVLFCGGLGLRIRDGGENVPKPMTIGYRPILWHVMKHSRALSATRTSCSVSTSWRCGEELLSNYNECASNDFTLSRAARSWS